MQIQKIYNRSYTIGYPDTYLSPFSSKHRHNLRCISATIGRGQSESWLDLGCGQAWFFRYFPEIPIKHGIDLSESQLAHATKNSPNASYFCEDMVNYVKKVPCKYNLITCFWGAYSYLGSPNKLNEFLISTLNCLEPKGVIYLELMRPKAIREFNYSAFAAMHNCKVVSISEDSVYWTYVDQGGSHICYTPYPQKIAETFQGQGYFTHLHRRPESFMVDLIVAKEESTVLRWISNIRDTNEQFEI